MSGAKDKTNKSNFRLPLGDWLPALQVVAVEQTNKDGRRKLSVNQSQNWNDDGDDDDYGERWW